MYDVILGLLGKAFGKRGAKIIVCLVLMSFKVSNSEIQKGIGVSYPTLRKYKSALESGVVEPLFELKAERMKSDLDVYTAAIKADFDANPPKTLKEAQSRINALTGITRSLNRLCVFLKKRALEYGQ